jgi:ABC-type multidrug transport system fused ATPase/permease subunit
MTNYVGRITSAISLLKESFWQYKYKFASIVLFGLIAGLFGGIGIGAVIPLFTLIADSQGQTIEGTDFISEKIQSFLQFFHLDYNVFILLGLIIILFILKALVTYYAHYINERIGADYERTTREELFKKTLKADWPYLSEQKVGYLESVFMVDVHSSASILGSLSSIIMVGTSMIMYAFIAINISASITLMTFGLGTILFFVFKPIFFKIRRLSYKLGQIFKDVSHHINQHIIGAKTVKATATEIPISDKGSEYFEKLKEKTIHLSMYSKIAGTFLEPIGLVFVSLIFVYYYYTNPNFNIASFAAIMYLIQKIFSFMQNVQTRLNNVNEAIPHLHVVYEYKKAIENHKEINVGLSRFKFENELVIKDLSFAYDREHIILSRLNISIKKGQMIGIIGPSGAGKTTLVDILLRLFEPGSGQILIDKKEASEINTASWRQKVGYVSQDIFLLNDTVANNIRFYNKSLTNKELIHATKLAKAYDFVKKLPRQFNTVVGERGVKLSGGQRQRIILARVLARKPELLILDEATSALDNESEVLIQNSIENLKHKMTVIVIAHRLSTIMNSDKLFVIDNGKLIEQGPPKKLLENKDSYFHKVYKLRN